MPDFIERDAMLFESGEYPERNLTVTDDDLDRLAAQTEDAPIHVEHAESPVNLGSVGAFERRGNQLWGKLKLYPEANQLLERLGVKSLSLKITRALDRIMEVSVTGSPRIEGAKMFSEPIGDVNLCVQFSLAAITPTKTEVNMADAQGAPNGVTAEEFSDLRKKLDSLTSEISAIAAERDTANKRAQSLGETVATLTQSIKFSEADRRARTYAEAGKLPPALVEHAAALLAIDGGSVSFGDQNLSVSEAFAQFLDKMEVVFGNRLSGKPIGMNSREARLKEATATFSKYGMTGEALEIAAEEFVKQEELKNG